MASIIQIGDKWRAQVRRKGHPVRTQTFSTKKLAQIWAYKKEAEIEQVRAGLVPSTGTRGVLLSVILERARCDKTAGKSKLNVLGHLLDGLGPIMLEQLTAQDIIKYVEGKGCGPATAQLEISVLGTVLKVAQLAWGYHVPDVMQHARTALKLTGKISKSKERNRRPTADELERICSWLDGHTALPMRDLIWFSVHTAMRASEVTRLRWEDFNCVTKTILIRDRKHPLEKTGNHQEVPLLDAAVEIIERQPRASDRIFPYNHRTFSCVFPKACQLVEPRIKDLRWHDLRHEGASRLFERGYQIHEVAMFTGHKDWKQLRRYTQLRAKDVRRLRPKQDPQEMPGLQELLMPLSNLDPKWMQPEDIKQQLDVIEQRTELIQRLRQQIETIDMEDTDRCILLRDSLRERTEHAGIR